MPPEICAAVNMLNTITIGFKSEFFDWSVLQIT